MAALLQKSASALVASKATKAPRASRVVVKASSQEVSRREVLSGVVSAATLLAASPAFAAYGDSANVFGRKTNTSGFVPFAGDGYSFNLPSKWIPSSEKEFPNQILRYADNFDAVNNLVIIAEKSGKNSVTDYGSPEKFLESYNFLLGKQAFEGKTISEGGFAPNRVSAASILDVSQETDKKGRAVYKFEVLTRTADGNEGGRHNLIKAVVANGTLYIMKAQVGDKRWFKGINKEALGAINTFTVA